MARLIVLASLLVSAAMASPFSDLAIFKYNPVAAPISVAIVGNARFTALSANLVRMEYTEKVDAATGKPVFEDRATQTFVNRLSKTPAAISATSNTVNGQTVTTITTGAVTITYANGQPFSAATLSAVTADGTQWTYGAVDNGNLLGTVRSLDELCTVSLNCTDNANIQIHDESLHCSWGVVSRNGWTTIDDSKGYIMSAVEGEWFDTANVNTNAADTYLFGHGTNYRAAIGDYVAFSGRAPLPRKQQLGAWFTRWYDYANGDVERLIGLFEQYRLPLDVLVLDMNWHTKNDWTGYSFDKELYPNVMQVPNFVHGKGLLLAANIHDADGIGWWEDKFPEMCAANGVDPAAGIAVPFLPLNQQYMHSLEDIVMKPLGIDTWWIDWQQGGWAGMCKNDDMNPTFITNHVRMTDAIRRNENVRSSILARWGGSGSQRYPVGFSGDVSQLTWECFAFQPYFSVTAANVGYGTISHDLVGPAEDHELHVRWMQFGAFSGIMRIHDRGMSAGSCWDDCPNVDIWRLPADYFNAIRDAMLAREALLPYIYTHNRAAFDSGVPLTYPMYYDSPNSPDAYLMDGTGTWAQYMFGPSILVSPITSTKDETTGLANKNIWLPTGTWWDDVYGALVTVTEPTGRRIQQAYDMTEIPMFYKAGAVIPRLTNPSEIAAGSKPFNNIDLYIYPGANSGSAVMYDDDGTSYNYLSSNATASQTTFAYTRGNNGKSITVTVTAPAIATAATLNLRVFLVASQPIASVSGVSATAPVYDGPSVTASVALAPVSTAASFTATIALVSPQVDAAFTAAKAFGYRGALAKRTLDNFRTTPYSTTAGPGMLKQMGSRGTYMSLLGANASASTSSSAEFQQLLGSYATLAQNAVTEISAAPVNPPSGPAMTALVQLWSAARKDMLLCGSETCLTWNSDYAVFGIEGYQPASGAEPFATGFYDYYDASNNDNWADTMSAAPAGYTIAGFSNGFIVGTGASPSSGSSPYNNLTSCMQVWSNPTTGDHFTFATDASLTYAKANGYQQVSACIGYALKVTVAPSASRSTAAAGAAEQKKSSRRLRHRHAALSTAGSGSSSSDAETLRWAEGVMRRARDNDQKQGINRPAMRDALLNKMQKSNAKKGAAKLGWSANAYASSLISTVIPASSSANTQ